MPFDLIIYKYSNVTMKRCFIYYCLSYNKISMKSFQKKDTKTTGKSRLSVLKTNVEEHECHVYLHMAGIRLLATLSTFRP